MHSIYRYTFPTTKLKKLIYISIKLHIFRNIIHKQYNRICADNLDSNILY